jgi:hypothetical protein
LDDYGNNLSAVRPKRRRFWLRNTSEQKLKIIPRLKLPEFDRSVLINVSALAKLTSLKSLDLRFATLLDVSTLPELKNLESLNLFWTKVVDVSALKILYWSTSQSWLI